MDTEFEFGELEQQKPSVLRPPNGNKHFAVVACGSPNDDDLAIYVDLDAMRDMERHALSDANVELGGVVLGGQYVDENGKPFVQITDSLRARHYKSSKGSFTFTHETWEHITRERNEFPDDVQMVGWYHTHPGWGVFLSGMDLFICNNFFNKPLDVALVIDPCNDDRGFFQWVRQEHDAVRRTGGFYLVASRFRQAELEAFAHHLEEKRDMTTPAAGPVRPAYSPSPPDPTAVWRSAAMIGMLSMQFLLLFLIAWRLTAPAAEQSALDSKVMARIEKLEQNRENRSTRTLQEEKLAAQREMLDRIITQIDAAPEGFVQSLEEERQKNAELRASVLGQNALNQSLLVSQSELKNTLEQTLASRQVERETWRRERLALERKTQKLQNEISTMRKEEGEQPSGGQDSLSLFWKSYGAWLGIAAAIVVAGAGLAYNASAKASQKSPENDQVTSNKE